MKIGIVGGGTAGRATARAWQEHCDEVRTCDMLRERATHSKFDILSWADLIFVCLPETEVEQFFGSLDHTDVNANFVLKSTVPIGTTRHLAEKYGLTNLVHSPEFLTERCAVWDAQNPARNIIGIPGFDGAARHPYPGELLCELCEKRFPGVQTIFMSSDESEAVKLFVNAFAAAKVSLFNEFRSLADALKLDWDRIIEGVLSDGRIGNEWTKVPGPDGKRGFGGKCLPKDLEMLCRLFGENEVSNPVTYAAEYWARVNDGRAI